MTARRNADPKPFVGHGEADTIIEKVRPEYKTLSQVKARGTIAVVIVTSQHTYRPSNTANAASILE